MHKKERIILKHPSRRSSRSQGIRVHSPTIYLFFYVLHSFFIIYDRFRLGGLCASPHLSLSLTRRAVDEVYTTQRGDS